MIMKGSAEEVLITKWLGKSNYLRNMVWGKVLREVGEARL
jgi:hypothetical protein